ncbi:MAG: acyl carrier protein [Nitrospirae bacterium]|nr:acyl carrier protein [Nitrospirota bacterium]
MDIRENLNQVFRKVFSNPSIEIHEAMTAADVKGWDSLSHVVLIFAIEKQFKISFTTKEVNSLKNIGDLIRLTDKKLNHAL